MANPTGALVPNQITTPNVPNTGTGVQVAPPNPQRNGLLVWNISGNILWIGGPSAVFVAGTQQQGTFALSAGQWIYFGGYGQTQQLDMPFPPMFLWTWTQSLFAQAAAGATNPITIIEF